MKFFLKIFLFTFFLIFLTSFLFVSFHLQKKLIILYEKNQSKIILDREGREIAILPNDKGNYARYLNKIPPRFKELLIKKEDRFFYFHFGFNPWSIFQSGLHKIGLSSRKASSTISQQLVKILLGKEKERNLKNKIIESFYALSLEIWQPKEKILKMYANSIYFGNQVQGIEEAARFYFGVSASNLTDSQILQILATISDPNGKNPLKDENKEVASFLAKKLKIKKDLVFEKSNSIKERTKNYSRQNESLFELSKFIDQNSKEVRLTVDEILTQKIREIVKRNLEFLREKKAENAAVIVIKLPENEILALVGSPDPNSFEDGYKINMLEKPRAVGSTIKPFIYLKAFEKGLRPYTLVEDREYKYTTGLGFPFYPKNFDWKYRGEINLHYALSNSLNVPTVKVLEYVGLEDFYKFLEKDLEFKSIQNLQNYQLGIALGALETSLMDLAKYFTIFANKGILRDLKIYPEKFQSEKLISEQKYIQLVNKILNDRKTGIEQFGLKSDLNLFQENYCVKTGTSRDFKDSWVVGFTPDFLVGVWVGNADNSKTDALSGQLGAGKIWADTMELLLNSKYNKRTPLDFHQIEEFEDEKGIEYGLKGDDFQKIKNTLMQKDNSLILSPHDGDVYLLEEDTRIVLKAKEKVFWFVNGKFLNYSKEEILIPKEGLNEIETENEKGIKEKISIFATY